MYKVDYFIFLSDRLIIKYMQLSLLSKVVCIRSILSINNEVSERDMFIGKGHLIID